MTAMERSCRRLCLQMFNRIRGGHLELIEPDGNRLHRGDPHSDLSAKVEIHSTGRFYGNIHAPALIIEEGAVFEGNCAMAGAGDRPAHHAERETGAEAKVRESAQAS